MHTFLSSNAERIDGRQEMTNQQRPAVDPVPQYLPPDYGESVTGNYCCID